MSAAAPVAAVEAKPLIAKNNLKWAIAVTVALGALLEIIDTTIVNVALTDMQASLGATLSEISWVVSSYAVANVIILPLTAWLGDRFGKKRYFIFSMAAFTIASMLCGVATNLPLLIVARVLQGLGGGGLLAKAQAILFETFPKEEQAMAQALFGVVVIAGPAIGPTLGGYIVTNLDWRWIFFINLPVGIVAVMMSAAFLPEDKKDKKPAHGIDWTAIAMLAVGLGCLQTMLEEGQDEDWFQSRFIVALFVTAIVSLTAFVIRELEHPHPVVDLRVLRYRSLWAGSILSVVVGMGLYGAMFSVPIFAQSILRLTSQQTGMLLLPGAITSAFMMPIAGKLLQKFDPRHLLAIGSVILIFAVWQLGRLTPQTGSDDFFWPLVIRSIGTPLMFLPLSMAALGSIPKEEVGAATGFYNLTRQLGGSIGVAILTAILSQRQSFHQAVLVEKMASTDPRVLDRLRMLTASFVARGFDIADAKGKAVALLQGSARAQAAVMSFNDTFTLTAFLLMGTLPLIFLLGKPVRRTISSGH